MPGTPGDLAYWLTRASRSPVAYLTTMGRQTGQPHRIEIWFAVEDGRMYLLAGGREQSDWVRNIQANARVTVELDGETHTGAARVIQPGTPADQRARELLVAKYQAGGNLDEWGRASLPVVVEFPEGGASSAATNAGREAW